jgi:hypothetical protein
LSLGLLTGSVVVSQVVGASSVGVIRVRSASHQSVGRCMTATGRSDMRVNGDRRHRASRVIRRIPLNDRPSRGVSLLRREFGGRLSDACKLFRL